ncbi:hypothetical protein BDBG_09282 [Blastomyces gilchristii SLH14081]|uniref:Uncharacterized protein n=1 Tax=Blastomyces gilchristii (strain SLH14081) TaxID=559298 RepID=A0A179V468_BLAGS|nr:uncharacterized protein BDBG_09282 [Blastomyces gilchristii SLH14081]OAT14217.1 hypothetical protein BDBG_09282 [Blastomyces gilchristii SLH14081]
MSIRTDKYVVYLLEGKRQLAHRSSRPSLFPGQHGNFEMTDISVKRLGGGHKASSNGISVRGPGTLNIKHGDINIRHATLGSGRGTSAVSGW